ncbi:hypothetical protein MC378_06730 [Polaribacter sp. MSW13]|uniref:Uncharacterized protein n=1 Tax=Polaribacter marinus TaxID=2916838 RepID=A0A9X1VMP7_9FLAO|nr:hypothetical protein [Polaribacter marinus]MCI2228858.1 hypothetical protein [Polaribacter marinus]
MKLVRACIYPKDIQRITGRSEWFGRNLINQMKDYFGKESHQFITAKEFSDYSGIALKIVEEYLMKVS